MNRDRLIQPLAEALDAAYVDGKSPPYRVPYHLDGDRFTFATEETQVAARNVIRMAARRAVYRHTGMTSGDLADVLSKHPRLWVDGIIWVDREAELDPMRGIHLEECNRAMRWLLTQDQTAGFNRRWSSYGLKHLFEDSLGYVPNGAFIAAAIHVGFRIKTVQGSLSVLLNISERTLARTTAVPKRSA